MNARRNLVLNQIDQSGKVSSLDWMDPVGAVKKEIAKTKRDDGH